MYREHGLDDPDMQAAWQAIHRMVAPFLTDIEPALLQGPVNLLRISLHPGRLAPRIANLNQWREQLLHTPAGLLHLISTTTVFGSPTDITLQELALEAFFPGNEDTAKALRTLAGQAQ